MMSELYSKENQRRQIFNFCKKYIEEIFRDSNGLSSSDIIENSVENLAFEIYSDLIILLDKIDSSFAVQPEYIRHSKLYCFYKYNMYNLNLLFEKYKVKIFLGSQKFVADENFLVAKEKYPDYFENFFLTERNRQNYRIEVFRIVQGLSIDDIIKKDISKCGLFFKQTANKELQTIDELQTANKEFKLEQKTRILRDNQMERIYRLFMHYLYDKVHTTNYGGNIWYPNDFNIGNFIVDYEGMDRYPYNLINIDYDHMVVHSEKQMIHNVSWSFVSRFFDTQTYQDSIVDDFIIEYRKNKSLLQEVERIKSEYLKTIGMDYDSKKERFNYPITLSMLNGNKDAYDYIEKMKTSALKKEETDD